MRFNIILLTLLIALTSCKNQEEENQDGVKETPETTTSSENNENTNTPPNPEHQEEGSNNTAEEKNSQEEISEGTYTKVGEEDEKCDYYCLEVDFEEHSNLCLAEDEIYINVRYTRSGNDINVFYNGPADNNINEEIPWDEFDTNEPIAVLSPASEGNAELDWKGFHKDGEIAVDYAIYGKKALEGTYIKK